MPKQTTVITSISDINLLDTFKSNVGDYEYSAQSNLKGWFEFTGSLTDRSTYSTEVSAANYETNDITNNGDAQLAQSQFDTTEANYPTYWNAEFTKGGTTRDALVTYSSTPTPVTFGDSETDDSAFSVSVWAKIDPSLNPATTQPGYLFSFGDGSGMDYGLVLEGTTGSEYVNFKLRKNSNGAFIQTRHQVGVWSEYMVWTHYVVTYDGSETAAGIKIYIDGTEVSVLTGGAGSYTGMRSNSNELHIGTIVGSSTRFDGFISELAFFDKVLSTTEIQAIYEGTARGSYKETTVYSSGRMTTPEKPLLDEIDSKIRFNSYNCVGTTYSKEFDDMNTVDFVTRTLNPSIGIETGTTSTPALIANSTDSTTLEIDAAFDSSFVTRQTLGSFLGDAQPFNEHDKTFLSSKFTENRKASLDEIDLSGLEETVDRMDIVEINVNPVSNTTFGVTGSVVADEQMFYPMVYWNDSLKRWERMGDGNYLATQSGFIQGRIFAKATIGFAPTEGLFLPDKTKDFDAAFGNYGLPVDNFGFPASDKFHATSSQCIDMSSLICEPFVVQKMEYVFDSDMYVDSQSSSGYVERTATTGSNIDTVSMNASMFTFFVMKQSNNDIYVREYASRIAKTADTSVSDMTSYRVAATLKSGFYSSRDLVNYMQVLIYGNGTDSEQTYYGSFNNGQNTTKYVDGHKGFLSGGLGRELNLSASNFIDSTTTFDSANYAHSGKLTITGTVRQDISHESYGIVYDIDSGNEWAIHDLGNVRHDSEIREKFNPRGFIKNTKAREINEGSSTNFPLFLNSATTASIGINTKQILQNNFNRRSPFILLPKDKLVLGWQSPMTMNPYGITGNPGESSQMTIKAGTGRLKLYGSYISNGKKKHKRAGSYSNNFITHTISQNVCDRFQLFSRSELSGSYNDRYFTGSIPSRVWDTKSNRQTDQVNSMAMYLRNTDNNELIYDSLIPDMSNHVSSFGINVIDGMIDTNTSIETAINHNAHFPIFFNSTKRNKKDKTVFTGSTNLNQHESRKVVYGDGFYQVGSGPVAIDANENTRKLSYGLLNIENTYNSAYFNARSFGNISDMLEQRKMYSYLDNKGKPIHFIERKLFSNDQKIDPIESFTQNLSHNATSSYPFIDNGLTTYRTDNPLAIDEIKIFSDLRGDIVI